MTNAIEKKGVGINPYGQIHYIDHLAPICVMMGIPLLFLDSQDYALGKKYYPDLQAQLEEYQELTPEYLIAKYDVLFMSDLWDRKTFNQKYHLLEKKYNKPIRHVHCPHGYSDKAFYLKKVAQEDITLIYGNAMLDMLKRHNVFEDLHSYVISGNFRYTYYKQNKAFLDRIVKEEVLNKFDDKRPVVLYAPTWLDLLESTTFFDASHYLLDQLSKDYNVIVKLHPRLELDDVVGYYQILGKYEERGNIVFLKDFPLVYPLLAHSDIYVGDTSSVGYDYLVFDKPMFFLNKNRANSKEDPNYFLYQCGKEIFPDEYPKIAEIIKESLPKDKERFSRKRKEVWTYSFGEERPFEEIKDDIIHAYSTTKKFP